jgi:hypothetical protein
MNLTAGALVLSEVTPTRTYSLATICLDSAFLIFFVMLLFFSKRRLTAIFALIGGLLYWAVDFGIFYGALHARTVSYYPSNSPDLIAEMDVWGVGGVLLWMSMSYGILDFAFIWLWLSRDKKALEFSALIVVWWLALPLLDKTFVSLLPAIPSYKTYRTTSSYHGVMGIILFLGYAYLIVKNIFAKKDDEKAPIVRLFVIGFMAQFLWEFILYLYGIRPAVDPASDVRTILEDSLIETNLGMPYLYLINKAIMRRYEESGAKKSSPAKAEERANPGEIAK